jgi:Nucleotidyl transferase AbiEii toxin, Type IV TA system
MQIKVRLDSRLTQRWAKHFSKQTLLRAVRVMGPTLVALTLAGVANTARAQGTISFSGAQTFMQTVQTFAIYAGAVICFGGLIFAGIRMMSGRFHEAVLERDYCLAWFLVGLSQSKIRDLLIFKGGTALKRCHFGDYRFSEDLDFTLARRVEFSEIRAGLEEVYELVAQGSGIRFSFESEGRQTHVNSYTFYLRYQGPLPTSNTVKVDITIAEILLFPVEQLPVLRT